MSETNPLPEAHLFIGGEHDGTRLPIPDHQQIILLPVPPKPPYGLEHDFDEIKVEYYRRKRLFTPEGQITVYTIEGMSDGQVLEQLVAGYRTRHIPAPVEPVKNFAAETGPADQQQIRT